MLRRKDKKLASRPFRRGRLTELQRRSIYQRATANSLPYCEDAGQESPLLEDWLPAPKADRIRRTSDDKPALPLEKHVLKAALKALRADPRVAFADRQQSGVFQDGDRHIRVGTPGKLDIVGMLKGGQYLELEAKRPGNKPDDRQALRIAFVREHGGVSGFFTSAEEAIALLP